jgi:hypothetical protein
VLLLYESVGQDDQEGRFLQRADELERLAVVNVVFDDPPADPRQTPTATLPATPPSGQLGNRSFTVRVPLHEHLEVRARDRQWGERTADELRFAQLWCQREMDGETEGRPPRVPAEPYALYTSDGVLRNLPSLGQALSAWVESTDAVLAWTQDGPSPAVVEQLLTFDEGEESRVVVAGFNSDADAIRFTPGQELSEQENASLARLIETGRVVLGVIGSGWGLLRALGEEPWSRGRALFVTNGLGPVG